MLDSLEVKVLFPVW